MRPTTRMLLHLKRMRVLVALPLLLGTTSCGTTVVEPVALVPTTIEVGSPSGPLTSLGESIALVATVRDQFGDTVTIIFVEWLSDNPQVATVDGGGRVQAVANGTATISATAGSLSAEVSVVVDQRVGSLRITPPFPVLELPGDTVTLLAEPIDALGNAMIVATPVTWSGTGAVTAGAGGIAEAVGFGTGTASATSGGVTSSVQIEVIGDRYFLSNGTRLRYALDLPAGPGPFPAVVFVHGSGPVNRNSQRDVTDPFIPLGVAAFRYDKRGVGESGGTYEGVSVANSNSTLGRLAEDAAAAARFLARLPGIDTASLGLIGNSQGGWIVPMAALQAAGVVRFIMLWSGPTVSVGLEIFYSNLAEGTGTPLDEVYAQLPSFTGPTGYDPLIDISRLDIPGIWQFGEMDRSIPMRLDVDRLGVLQAQGKPFEWVTWEFGDHALRDVRTGQFYDVWSEYTRFMRDHGFLPAP